MSPTFLLVAALLSGHAKASKPLSADLEKVKALLNDPDLELDDGQSFQTDKIDGKPLWLVTGHSDKGFRYVLIRDNKVLQDVTVNALGPGARGGPNEVTAVDFQPLTGGSRPDVLIIENYAVSDHGPGLGDHPYVRVFSSDPSGHLVEAEPFRDALNRCLGTSGFDKTGLKLADVRKAQPCARAWAAHPFPRALAFDNGGVNELHNAEVALKLTVYDQSFETDALDATPLWFVSAAGTPRAGAKQRLTYATLRNGKVLQRFDTDLPGGDDLVMQGVKTMGFKDVTGDGKGDVVVVERYQRQGEGFEHPWLRLFSGQGNGQLTEEKALEMQANQCLGSLGKYRVKVRLRDVPGALACARGEKPPPPEADGKGLRILVADELKVARELVEGSKATWGVEPDQAFNLTAPDGKDLWSVPASNDTTYAYVFIRGGKVLQKLEAQAPDFGDPSGVDAFSIEDARGKGKVDLVYLESYQDQSRAPVITWLPRVLSPRPDGTFSDDFDYDQRLRACIKKEVGDQRMVRSMGDENETFGIREVRKALACAR